MRIVRLRSHRFSGETWSFPFFVHVRLSMATFLCFEGYYFCLKLAVKALLMARGVNFNFEMPIDFIIDTPGFGINRTVSENMCWKRLYLPRNKVPTLVYNIIHIRGMNILCILYCIQGVGWIYISKYTALFATLWTKLSPASALYKGLDIYVILNEA